MIGKKLTIFCKDEDFGETMKREIEILRFDFCLFKYQVYCRGVVDLNFVPIKFKKHWLVFDGWDIPIQSYYDAFDSFHSFDNDDLNLVGDEAVIKDYIENRNLNARFDPSTRIKIHECVPNKQRA